MPSRLLLVLSIFWLALVLPVIVILAVDEPRRVWTARRWYATLIGGSLAISVILLALMFDFAP